MELIDALKSYTDPANDGIKSKKDALRVYDRVKDVCSPLITMEDTNGSQKISLCHKSVKDFFIDPKNKRRIEEYLPDFFIDENKALEELGVSCIEYISEERYQDPSDLKALVTRPESSYNNAFLRYAAVFWHMHMQDITPSSETLKTVEDFLKSPAFWTCIYVQSHAAPHLFARYKRETSHYKPILGPKKTLRPQITYRWTAHSVLLFWTGANFLLRILINFIMLFRSLFINPAVTSKLPTGFKNFTSNMLPSYSNQRPRCVYWSRRSLLRVRNVVKHCSFRSFARTV
jgi:hypothetical protein